MKTLLCLLILTMATLAAPAPPSLAWDANDPAEEILNYNVYRRTGPATAYVYTLLGSTPTPTYPLVGIVPGNNVLVVTAVNVWGESEYSDPITLPVAPGKPRNVRVQITITP